MSSNVGEEALRARSRKPEVSRSRHFAEGERSIERPAVQTGVSGDADYENVFRENFRRPRRGWYTRPIHAILDNFPFTAARDLSSDRTTSVE